MQERQSLLHCLSDTNRTMSLLMTEKEKLAERLSKTHGDHAKDLVMCVTILGVLSRVTAF